MQPLHSERAWAIVLRYRDGRREFLAHQSGQFIELMPTREKAIIARKLYRMRLGSANRVRAWLAQVDAQTLH